MAASLTYKYCHVAPWSATSTPSAPEMSSIPIWAHLKGVPLDLRSQEGLSFAAGLVGEPKETDDYTKNLTNIEIAHVKVDADLSQKLPQLVHLKRQSGEIIPVQVEYPWVPPSCSFCHQIGHIIKDCLQTTSSDRAILRLLMLKLMLTYLKNCLNWYISSVKVERSFQFRWSTHGSLHLAPFVIR